MLTRARCQSLLLAPFLLLAISCTDASDPSDSAQRAASKEFLVTTSGRSLHTGEPLMDQAEADRYRRTLTALVKSPRVINSALRKLSPESIPFVPQDASAKAWLQDNLRVEFTDDSDVMKVSLPHPSADEQLLRSVVDAVATAFVDEAVLDSRLRAKQGRDVLAQAYQVLQSEIQRKEEALRALYSETHSPKLPAVQLQIELARSQIDRLQAALLDARHDLLLRRIAVRTETEDEAERERALSALDEEQTRYAQQIQQQIGELTEDLQKWTEASTDLDSRERALAGLKKVQQEVGERIEWMDIDLRLPERVIAVSGVDFTDPDDPDALPQ